MVLLVSLLLLFADPGGIGVNENETDPRGRVITAIVAILFLAALFIALHFLERSAWSLRDLKNGDWIVVRDGHITKASLETAGSVKVLSTALSYDERTMTVTYKRQHLGS